VAVVLSAALPFALYLRTVAPTVYGVDSAELTTGSFLLGIVHPPGAPTYLLLGHVFTWLPFGDVGYRVNLMSACAGAASLLVLHLILRRLGCAAGVALATSLLVSSTYYVWASAVAAEVYALQACFAAVLILLALRARENGRGADLVGLGLLLGVGLGVHPSLALLAPGLALLVLTSPPAARPTLGRCLLALAFTLVGAGVYLYLPLRYAADLPLNPARDSWRVDLATWQGFWWMVTARGFARLFFAAPPSRLAGEIATYAYQVWSNFMGLGALVGAAGLIAGLRRCPSVHLSFLAMLIVHLGFFLPYGAPDKHMMLLPTHLLWGIWIGVAAQHVADRSAAATGRSARNLAAAGLAGMALLTATVNFRFLDVSHDHSARARGETLLEILAPNAVFFGSFPDLRIVEYLQFVEGRRGDVKTIDLLFATPPERRQRILEQADSGAPVYVRSCRDWEDRRWRCEEIEDGGCARLLDDGPPAARAS
jgi:hypothetical protein